MLAMLLFAAALMKSDFIEARPRSNADSDYYSLSFQESFVDEDYMTMNTQQLYQREQEIERIRNALLKLREMKPTKKMLRMKNTEEFKQRFPEDEIDVVDREDHFTQFLADMFVNTDSEITVLQAVEPEETYGPSVKDDAFYDFLSSQSKVETYVEPEDDLTR